MSRAAAVFAVWLFAFLLSYFFRSANAVIAGDLRAEFGLDAAQLGLMTSAFFAALALAQLPLGVALDRWGPRRVVPAMMLAGAAGALLFAGARDLAGLTAGRALLGLGFAGVFMGALQALAGAFPARRYATVAGLLAGLGAAGALLAGTPLAHLATALGWRAAFAWGAAVVLRAAAAIAAAGGRHAAPDPATGGGSLATVLRDARLWRIALLNLFSLGTLLAVQGLWGGPFLADVHGLDTIAIGDLLVLMGIGVVAGNLASGALADRLGRRRVALAGGGGFAAAHALLVLLPPGTPVAALGAVYLAFGALASFGVVLLAQARSAVPAHLGGRALTTVNLVGIGGAMLVQWAMGAIIEAGRDPSGAYGAAAYRPAFALTTLLGAVALAWYAGLRDPAAAAAPAPGHAGERTSPP